MESKDLMVSVFMITYNHEQYIKEALDSILGQVCSFKFNVVIGDDCSTDHTRAILNEYATKFPDRIKLLLHEKNIGAFNNQLTTLAACKGKYIAICEGDDYWIDVNKLQAQVDNLESHQGTVLSFHPVMLKQTGGELIEDDLTNLPKTYNSLEDLARYGNYIHTPSVVFRNNPEWMKELNPKFPIGDYPMFLLICRFGNLIYHPKTMAVYRIHAHGIHSTKPALIKFKNWFLTFHYLIPIFNGEVKQILIERYLKMAPTVLSAPDLLTENQQTEIIQEIAKYNPAFFTEMIIQNQALTKSGKSIRWNLQNLKQLIKKKIK